MAPETSFSSSTLPLMCVFCYMSEVSVVLQGHVLWTGFRPVLKGLRRQHLEPYGAVLVLMTCTGLVHCRGI
jgi:hypothetical protein